MASPAGRERPTDEEPPSGELADWVSGHVGSHPPSALLPTVLAEVVDASAPFDLANNSGRARLTAEASACLRMLGPGVRALLSGHLQQLIAAARSGNRPMALRHARSAMSSLATLGAANAAFDDLVATVAAPSEPPETVEWRRNLVADISGMLDLSWLANGRLANGILADRALAVAHGQALLGLDAIPWSGDDAQDAGLPWAERLGLAKGVLLSPLEPAHHVVWLAIDRARVNLFPSVRVGAVEFFHLDVVRRALEQDEDRRLPPELAKSGSVSRAELPEEPDMILARVDLGLTAINDPVDRARTLLRDLLGLVSFEVGLSGRGVWRLWSGHWHAVNGQVVGWGRFEFRDEFAVYRDAYEAVGAALIDMAKDTSQDPTQRATGFGQVLSWLEQAVRADPAMASLLYVRVIESVIATTKDSDWQRFADKYFQGTWIRYQIRATLVSLLRRSTRWLGPIGGRIDSEQRAALDTVSRAVFTWLPGLRYEANLASAVEHLPTVVTAVPYDSALGRETRVLQSRLESVETLQLWTKALRQDWRLLTTRLNQVRNEVAHRSHTATPLAETTSSLGAFLAAQVAFQSAEALAGVKSLEESCRSVRKAADLWFEYLHEAPTVAAAVAGPQ